MFAEKEIAYFQSQPLARMATVAEDGQPDNTVLAFEYDGAYFYVGGVKPDNSRKYKNLRAGNDKVALLIDDMESIQPWKPRGIRIYGTAEFVERSGQFGPGTYMRITPEVSWSWDLVGPAMTDGKFQPNKIIHSNQ